MPTFCFCKKIDKKSQQIRVIKNDEDEVKRVAMTKRRSFFFFSLITTKKTTTRK